jgi:hypothetical protein
MGSHHLDDFGAAGWRRFQLQSVASVQTSPHVTEMLTYPLVTDLQVYPASVFLLLMSAGLYIVRYHRKKLNAPRSEFRAWDVVVIFNIIVNLYLIIMPWYPPSTGRNGGDVTFWYATYVVTGISM